jgi:cyclopropane-fatty-acyl-phospholipid synthase
MSLAAAAGRAVERAPIPDRLTRLGIGYLVARARRRLQKRRDDTEADFADNMRARPIAENTAEANSQHYELPPEFFRLILGPRRKYSCCLYDGVDNLPAAEERALAETCVRADLSDGQQILELGCGWGSLSLWMAQHYPTSRITAVSNSRSQREAIEAVARDKGFSNLTVITKDMNEFATSARFDRILSVEMFEHMSNWRTLLERAAGWMRPEARLFLHVFSHCEAPYRFNSQDKGDWIAQHFFTGGIMPSHGLIRHFPDLFEVEAEWRWSGKHYQRTAMDWLANFDRHPGSIDEILRGVYGDDLAVWKRRWRVFFLATAGLFGDSGGSVWGVSHYRLKPSAAVANL